MVHWEEPRTSEYGSLRPLARKGRIASRATGEPAYVAGVTARPGGSVRVARTSSPVKRVQRPSAPLRQNRYVLALGRHAEHLVLPLRERGRVLERTGETLGLALRRPARVIADVREDESGAQRQHDEDDQDLDQRETAIDSTRASADSRRPARFPSEIPRADVGVDTGAAGGAVRAEAEDVDFAAHAGIEVLVRMSPRIVRQPLEVAVRLPVGRQRRDRSGARSVRRVPARSWGSAGCRGDRASAPTGSTRCRSSPPRRGLRPGVRARAGPRAPRECPVSRSRRALRSA